MADWVRTETAGWTLGLLPTRRSSFAHANGIVIQVELPPCLFEYSEMHEAEPLQQEFERCENDPESITNAAAEIDGRSFFEIMGGTGELADTETKKQRLCQHFVVENKIIGIFEQRQCQQNLAAERAISRVIFG